MPQPSKGFVRVNGKGDPVPYHDGPDGVRRLLGFTPSPPGHPVFGASGWKNFASAAGLPQIAVADMKPFKRTWSNIPLLDQSTWNACVEHSLTVNAMMALGLAGDFRVPLSPWFVFTLVDGGHDGPTSPADAIDAMAKYGMAPDSAVPHGTVSPPGYSKAALAAALDCLLLDHIQYETFEDVVNGVYYGLGVSFDVTAGEGFDTDARGVIPVLPGDTDHYVLACEQFNRLADGTPVLGVRNSYGTGWGVGGRGWATEKLFAKAREARAVRAVTTPKAALPPAVPA